jgi:hypothetical protein
MVKIKSVALLFCHTSYMAMSWDQNWGKCHNIMRANKFFERLKQFKYLGTTKQIQIPFVKKLKGDWTRRILAIIQYRIFCLSVCYQKYKCYDKQNYNFTDCLYGCQTWSLTLREKRRLKLFEIRVLRNIFGPKRDEVTVEWRRLRNEEL